MKPVKEKIQEWVNNGADYDNGVAIYSELLKGRGMTGMFVGRGYRYADKLMAELCKLGGLNYQAQKKAAQGAKTSNAAQHNISRPATESHEPEYTVANSGSALPGTHNYNEVEPARDLKGYPISVIKLIDEYSRLSNERSITHLKMGELPEDNRHDTVEARRKLFDRVKELSARLEVLYTAKEAWFADKTMPDEVALWPDDEPDPLQELPEDPILLKKIKKNLQTNVVKQVNRLDYQDVRKSETKHPMPVGPKRQYIEKKIAAMKKKIEEIDYMLNKFI